MPVHASRTARADGAGHVTLPPEEREAAGRLYHHLLRLAVRGEEAPPSALVVGDDVIAIPPGMLPLLRHLADILARGEAAEIVPVARELTTGQAADLLGVSRQYLVRILDEGKIPFTRTGRHRRVPVADLLIYKEARDLRRRASLAEFTRLTQEAGEYP